MNNAEIKSLYNQLTPDSSNVSYVDFNRRMKAAMSPVSQQELAAMELVKARQRTAKALIDKSLRERGRWK